MPCPDREAAPVRDELVLKLILAAARGRERLRAVIQSERRAAVEALQTYTRLLRDPAEDADLGWLLLLDSLIFKTEAQSGGDAQPSGVPEPRVQPQPIAAAQQPDAAPTEA